ncbi:LysR family transcriptional regulator [Marinimicrobium sp. C2-29]|uniref:LysR family transcriptional regulator n=1 Tax=Marinimicrobium sp. C2-29 TaxID=3139825 RepID=UPI003139DB92
MDIELLKTFIEVTQTRHFGRAAHRLFLTPAAVSARIRQLEQTLGTPLFYRARGNIQMTGEGQRLLPHAQRMLDAWAEARRDLAGETEVSRHLSLGATPGLWHFALGEVSSRLHRALPDLVLGAEAYPQEELLERLRAEQLDLVVLYDRPGDADLKARAIGQLDLALLASEPGLELKTALAGDYIYVDWGAAFALFHARHCGDVQTRLRTNQASVALDRLRQVQGSAYLPQALAGSGLLYPVADAPEFHRPLYAAFRAEQEFNPVLGQVLDVLAESAPESA